MQPRLAALLFALGLVDLAYINRGLGHELVADASLQPPIERSSPSVEEPARMAREPSPPIAGPELVDREGVTRHMVPPESPPTPQPTPALVPPTPERAGPLGTDLMVGFPDKATAVLTRSAREELLALAARLREHPGHRVHIVGHADARGTREFNRGLGGRRARAVTALLARAGVPRRRIETESRGEDEPRAVGTSERVWAANRRVEITLGRLVERGRNDRSETP